MICPLCQENTKVIDSRLSDGGHAIRRRRKCVSCDFRYSTLEEMRLLDLLIVKRDGRREPYKREKVAKGLEIALRKRSYTTEDFRHLIQAIELGLYSLKTNEIISSELGEIVIDKLREFDKVAYIRFASVYRQFEDVKTFERELKALEE